MNGADTIVLFEAREAAELIVDGKGTAFMLKRLQVGLRLAQDAALSYVVAGDFSQPWPLLDPAQRADALVCSTAAAVAARLADPSTPAPERAILSRMMMGVDAHSETLQIHRDELARWLGYCGIESAYSFACSPEPEPAASSSPIPGLPTTEITDLFRSKTRQQWKQAFDKDRPAWLIEHRLTPGKAGRGGFEATWDPIGIAVSLYERDAVPLTDLDKLFRSDRRLSRWLDKWDKLYRSRTEFGT